VCDRVVEIELVGDLDLLMVEEALNDLEGVREIELDLLAEPALEGSTILLSDCEIVEDGEREMEGDRDLLTEKDTEIEGVSEAVGVALGGPGSADLDGVIVLVGEMEIDAVIEAV